MRQRRTNVHPDIAMGRLHARRNSRGGACFTATPFLSIALLLLPGAWLGGALTDTAVVSTSRELYSALGTSVVTSIYLTQTVKLDDTEWVAPLNVTRDVIIAAHPTFQAIGMYITLDLANLGSRVYLHPGTQLTFRWLELLNYVVETGPAMLMLGASPGAHVVFDHVVQRRRVGLDAVTNLKEMLVWPRLADEKEPTATNQTAFYLPVFCYNASSNGFAQACTQGVAYMADVATQLGPVVSPFLAPGQDLGQYDILLTESVHSVDVRVPTDCMEQEGLSAEACVVHVLRQLDLATVTINTKRSDSNIVKIVASLTVLLVAVGLFLYLRRHHRTYQQRRARRMRRLKEALGAGPNAHGVMFSGLEGEEPDWQLVPMPLGYVTEEGDTQEEAAAAGAVADDPSTHPDATNRELLMQDISTHPAAGAAAAAGGAAGGGGDEGGGVRRQRQQQAAGATGNSPSSRGGGGGGGEAGPSGQQAQAQQHQQPYRARTTTITGAIARLGSAWGSRGSSCAGVAAGRGTTDRGSAVAAAAAAAGHQAVRVAVVDAARRVAGSRGGDVEAEEGVAEGEQGTKEDDGMQEERQGEEQLVEVAAPDGAAGAAGVEGTGSVAGGGSGGGGNVLAELEALRRGLLAGVNDTQLHIQAVVGSGAYGTVYRGQWQGLEVAVKTLVFSASSENRRRALQEAALCQSINHRNIVATYAVDVQPLGALGAGGVGAGGGAAGERDSTLSSLLDWRLYIVQEYCDGGPLRKLVQSRCLQTPTGPNMPVICELALELAHALAHLHSKNIIHGDLNPNNVLLKRDPTSAFGFRVKMADFGLSVMLPLQKTHLSNLRLGTLYYIAPETCFRGQLGYAADVFSLGVMLWELYHGRLAGTRTPAGEPRYQPDFPDFPPACPPDFRRLAHRCLQKHPHNRLHSSQVVQRLQEMLAAHRVVAAAAAAAAAGTGGVAAGVMSPPPLPYGGPADVSMRRHGWGGCTAGSTAAVPSPPPAVTVVVDSAAPPPPQAAAAAAGLEGGEARAAAAEEEDVGEGGSEPHR
ncbi:hypothetical protein Agub_g9339 [Astrephomene gubernaculifera]|uniref:Protein kinase domain-containing protein n=1 Tax=Astrephomene gubernaculifera TaxID=47775 RepID=A0AAD3DUZ7_9CHLO|nr:hypothetical protein Agub_g9339 [Astrephomene gubernaculifera]